MAIILERTTGGAKLFLDGVNEVLKKVSIVKTNDLLSSLQNSGKQTFIDLAVQCWNEAIHQLYSTADVPLPFHMKTDSITLVQGQKDYALADDMVTLFPPLHDETNGHYMVEYPGGYTKMNRQQPQPANYTGSPSYYAINQNDGKLYIDRAPTTAEAGRVYYYDYGKELELAIETDPFPFDTTVFWAMVPVVTELYRLYEENKYVDGIAKISFGRAARYLIKVPQRTSYLNYYGHIQGDPLNAE